MQNQENENNQNNNNNPDNNNRDDPNEQLINRSDNNINNPNFSLFGEKMTLDRMINKIGYNYYHFILIIIVALILFSDGIEVYITYILAPIIQQLYKVTNEVMAVAITANFCGIFIGSFFSGMVMRKYGRRKPILLCLIIIVVTNPLSIAINSLAWFAICRLIIGTSMGISINVVVILAEVLPKKFRDFLLGSIYAWWKVGKLMFVVLCWYTIDEEDHRLWKNLVLIAGIPIMIALVLCYIFYEESPRLLFVKGNIEDGFRYLSSLAAKSNIVITDQEKEDIVNQINENDYNYEPSIGDLFTDFFKTKRLSIILIFMWFLSVFVTYTIAASLPLYFKYSNSEKKVSKLTSKNLEKIMISLIFPIIAVFAAGLLTSCEIFGRKWLIFATAIVVLSSSITQVVIRDFYYVFTAISESFICIAAVILKLYTVEAYSTHLRDFAFGFLMSVSRFAMFLTPLTTEGFFKIGLYASIFACIIGMTVVTVLTFFLPFDTFFAKLDVEKNTGVPSAEDLERKKLGNENDEKHTNQN